MINRILLCLCFCASSLGVVSAQNAPPSADSTVATIKQIVADSQEAHHLKAVIVQVRSDGKDVYTGAVGESMTGVPATGAMHFRNGAMAFTYMATMLLELVDQKKVSLDAKVSEFYPNLPFADRITLKNLANMTSGYADYVYQNELLEGYLFSPFKQWSPEELIQIGVSKPMLFAPGTNWGYSHTNYVILGNILQKITGLPLNEAMQVYIFKPMGLTQTQGLTTPQIPEPVLHVYSSERREALGIKPDVAAYEESTFWNPSWTTNDGAVQVTDITDFSRSLEAVGSGQLLSKESSAAQIQPSLLGFGQPQPGCTACRKNTEALTYGLGVMLIGPWIAQDKSFSGCSATVGYLPSQKLTISVVVTYQPEAFDKNGGYNDMSIVTFKAIAATLAPKTLPTDSPK